MKVLLVNKYHYVRGGAERAYFDMAKILEEAGHEVAFFAMEHPENLSTPWSKYFVKNVEYHQEHTSFGEKIRLAARLIYNVEARQKMTDLLEDFEPDVVHFHNIYHQLSPSIIGPVKKRGIPLLMTLHDYKLVSPNYSLFVRGRIWEKTGGWACIWDRAVQNSYARSFVCALETWVERAFGFYRRIDLFLSPSFFLQEKYRELGFRSEIRYFPNVLLPSPETPARERDPFLFVFFGRLSVEKGVDQLLEAWTLVPKTHRLVIAGEGPEKHTLLRLSEELGLRERVTFVGQLNRAALERLKGEATAILLPSRWYENMPYALLESLQSGSLVIASRRGGITERIEHGVNGFLFDPEKPGEVAEILEGLSGVDQESIRRQAKESVLDMAPALVLPELLSLYRELGAKEETI